MAATSQPSQKAPTVDPVPPDLRPFDQLGSYQILSRLGGGGMATIYVARSTLGSGADRLVAFKTALPDFGPDTELGSLFLNEARVSATLQHPNVVQVFDVGEAAGRPYIAMEYLQGRDLSVVLNRAAELGVTVPLEVSVAVALELCRALQYVHEKKDLDGRPLGLVHRDVTPGNVLLTRDGSVKLMDFGVASVALGAGSGRLLVGRRSHSCPEQMQGLTPTPSWDVYSVGVIISELVRGCELGPARAELAAIAAAAAADRVEERVPSAALLGAKLEALQKTLRPPAVARFLTQLFGDDLERQEQQHHGLIADARRRTSGQPSVLWRPFRPLQRRLLSSGLYLRHRRLFWAAVWAVFSMVAGVAGVGGWRRHVEGQVREQLAAADARVGSGRWVGPGGDQAIDHLRAAAALRPDDARVAGRLERLADAFEKLGEAALARGDLAEAIVHFEAARAASPQRQRLAQQVTQIELQVRERAKARRHTP